MWTCGLRQGSWQLTWPCCGFGAGSWWPWQAGMKFWAMGRVGGALEGGRGTGRAGSASGLWHYLNFQASPSLHPSQPVALKAQTSVRYEVLISLLRLTSLIQSFGTSIMASALFFICVSQERVDFHREKHGPSLCRVINKSIQLWKKYRSLVQKFFLSVTRHFTYKVEKCHADKISLPAYFIWNGSCSSSMRSTRAAIARAGQCHFCAHLKTWHLPSPLSCLSATLMLSPLHVSTWRTAEANVKWGVLQVVRSEFHHVSLYCLDKF